ncbi:PDZ domain-containing protein [bacterium]|nr:PDZ domain-containing protein [bacterium]
MSFASFVATHGAVRVARADDVSSGKEEKALAEAKALEKSIETVVEKAAPAFVVIGGGSGIIVTDDGYMLTNFHVAGMAPIGKPVGQTWRVKVAKLGILDAKVIGHDEQGDITLLQLQGKGPFPHVDLADSDALKVGDFALALGNPFGFAKDATPTVTAGVVSAIHRFQGGYSDAIQTDAAINPGNSGGPLLDSLGRLVGINGRIAYRHGTKINTGVGYSIPSNQIKRFLDSFKKQGVVHHGFVSGVKVGNTPDGGLGAVVEDVRKGSTAEKAGMKKGDVIVEADGRSVPHAARFFGIVGTIPAGEEIKLKVRRGDDTQEVSIKLEAHHSEDATSNPHRTYLGVKMATRDKDGGVEIIEVTAGSPAELAGIKVGDVVTEFEKKKVGNLKDLLGFLTAKKPGDTVKVALEREGEPLELSVKLGKREGE